jgi:hypothetical protein
MILKENIRKKPLFFIIHIFNGILIYNLIFFFFYLFLLIQLEIIFPFLEGSRFIGLSGKRLLNNKIF